MIWKVLLFSLFFVFSGQAIGSSQTEVREDCAPGQSLLLRALDISYTESANDKTGKAQDLMVMVNSLSPEDLANLDQDVIDGISLLLKDPEYWVKVYAAMSLGIIGPRAAKALPDLEHLKHTLVEPYDPDQLVDSPVDGIAAIETAIREIQGSK